jgi:hypothetical protein
MSVSIYDPAAARDLIELRQYIHTTISQSRPVDMANRLGVINEWLDRITFENKESFRTALGILRSNLGVYPDATQIRLCASMLELLLEALPADVC